jgi:aminoglycoside phosphotransferase (APT) family kinase protein
MSESQMVVPDASLDLATLTPILADLGLAAPVDITNIKADSSKVFRIDLADGTPVVLKAYDRFNTAHHVVAGETFASRLLDGFDLPVTRYLVQDETHTRLPFAYAITNYIPGDTVKSFANAPDVADLYRQMGGLLRRLHAIALPAFGQFGPDGVVDPVATNAEQMRRSFTYAFARFREHGGGEALARRLEAMVEARFDAMTTSRGPVFSHDDLNPTNVLAERDASGRLRLTGLIDFGNARAADAVSDLAKTLFNTEHELTGSSPYILEGCGPIDHPDPEGALRLYTLHHRVVMWWWLRHVGFIADGETHDLIRDLEAMVEAG